jgi:hypothetical protein
MPKKIVVEEMRELAEKRGGKALSKEYVNCQTKMKWKCNKGHTWEATPAAIKHGKTWCPICNKPTIVDTQRIAEERGGKCLSKEYVNTNTPMKWECNKGHHWKTTLNSIKNNKTWCPHCAGKTKLTLDEVQKAAKERGGECLSKEYINNNTKMKFQCKEGHIWKTTLNSIKNSRWCPVCNGNTKLTIEEVQKIAEERGGKCLSKEYINNNTKMKFQCKEGHTWETKFKSIKSGSWCPICRNPLLKGDRNNA